jgi:hypothetical protein
MMAAREVAKVEVDVTLYVAVAVEVDEASDDAAVDAGGLDACTGQFLDLVQQP